MTRLTFLCVTLLASAALPTAARAQSESVLIEPGIAPDYRRGRNVSVTERLRPDYDPLGIRSGGFLIFPRLSLGAGATDNVFLSADDPESDVFLSIAPSVSARSDWSRHQVLAAAGVEYRPYLSNGRRSEFAYFGNLLGRVDVGSEWAFTGELQGAKVYETPFSGEVDSDIATLSSYHRGSAIVRAQHTQGRLRLTSTLDYNVFEFEDVELTSGTELSQEDRDRDIARVAVQGEYALSPSLVVYGQGSYAHTEYDRILFSGLPNRDSNAVRVLAGASLDISGFLRGNLGVGYTWRNYDSPLYRDVSGLSVDGRVEYFPTELTTVTLNLRRALQDSNFGDSSAFFDNRATVRLDHELRRNVLVNASATYAHLDYVDSERTNDIYQVRGGGRYLLNRSLSLRFDVARTSRDQRTDTTSVDLREVRGEIGIILHR